MFDLNKRGSRPDENVDDELEKDRFGTATGSAPPPREPRSEARVREAAIIGPSIQIDGDLRGEEDLIVEGRVSGAIHLREHTVTIGTRGQVKANVYANSVYVDGMLEGDLYGSERVAVRKGGSVRGNIVSPRVALDDGASFKGSIEMDDEAVAAAFGRTGQKRDADRPSGEKTAAEKPSADKGARDSGTGAGAGASTESQGKPQGQSGATTATGASSTTSPGAAVGGSSGKS